MSKHTPGPWVQNKDEQHYIADADIVVGPVDEGKQFEVCIVSEWDYDREQAKANAKMIAAAPEMYEALKLAHATLMHWSQMPPAELAAKAADAQNQMFKNGLQARAALAKMEGD